MEIGSKLHTTYETNPNLSQANPFREKVYEYPDRIFDSRHSNGLDQPGLRKLLENPSNQDLYLEIGSGSGMHLIEQARRNPDSLFIGVERRFKRAVRTIEKAVELEITNIYIVRASVELLFPFLKKGTLSGIHILFPDPWPKPKDWKNRTLNEANLEFFASILKPNGSIQFKTDHLIYYRWVMQHLKKLDCFSVEAQSEDLYENGELVNEIKSEFESLFLSKGLPICRLKLKRCSP